MKLADKIIEERKKKGYSQEELADRLNITRQAISKWESDQATPDIDNIIKMAQIFNVSTDYLLKDDVQKLENERDGIGEEKLTFSQVYWGLVPSLYLLISVITKRWDITWIIWVIASPIYLLIRYIKSIMK